MDNAQIGAASTNEPRLMLLGFGVGALCGELAGLRWQHRGAGNSVGNCGIVAAIVAFALLRGSMPVRLAALAVGACGVVLLLGEDIHGAAFVGALIALVLIESRGFEAEGRGRLSTRPT